MKLNESDLKILIENILDGYNPKSPYYETFSQAVQIARAVAEKKGYVIDEDDWWEQINTGAGKPKEGQTTKAMIGLSLNGKKQRKTLNIQVYNMGLNFGGGRNYELNHYIS